MIDRQTEWVKATGKIDKNVKVIYLSLYIYREREKERECGRDKENGESD